MSETQEKKPATKTPAKSSAAAKPATKTAAAKKPATKKPVKKSVSKSTAKKAPVKKDVAVKETIVAETVLVSSTIETKTEAKVEKAETKAPETKVVESGTRNIKIPPRFTTATKITIIRLCLLPLIMFFYLSSNMFPRVEFFFLWGKAIALILFVIAAITDFVDGYIARKYDQVSDLGKLLDPIADKLLTTLGFILIVTDFHIVTREGWWSDAGMGMFPVWFAALVIMVALSRDFIVSFVRQIAAEKGIVYAANWSGKIKTTVQLVAQVMVMFFAISYAHNHDWLGGVGTLFDIFSWTCVFLFACVVILNAYSTIDYIVKYQEKLKAKK